MITFLGLAQSFTGTVLDQNSQQPIPFAQVYFVDLKTGTITDKKGTFKIENIKQKQLHLQISFVGYKTINDYINLDSVSKKTYYLEESHFDLHEVVVSVPTGKLQGENIVAIEHKKMEDLQITSPLTLTEAISNIPGVEQNTTGSGIGKPVIRGLSGNRIVTYAQGIRIENQQWGSEHGLGVGDVGIESVEVIKGPASLLYGSDALGGVLFFIDERYANQNSVEGFVETKFLSNALGSINNAGIKINKKNVKFNLFTNYSSFADYQTPDFKRVYNTRFDQKNVKAALGYNNSFWITNLRYSFLQNDYGIVDTALYTSNSQRSFELPYQIINNQNLSLENTFLLKQGKINLFLGYSNNYRREFEDDAKQQAMGLKLDTYTYNLKWYSPIYKDKLNFIVGSQGMHRQNSNNGLEYLIPNSSTTDAGAFVVGNLKLKNLNIQAGVRADMRQINAQELVEDVVVFPNFNKDYQGLTYSLGGLYKFKKIKLRGNLSSGFRAPTTSELLANGVHEGTNRYIIGNQKLKNEIAQQVDFTIEYQYEHLSFSVSPFLNVIDNYIYLTPTDSVIDGKPVYEYKQSNAYLYGGEAGFHYHPHQIHWLHISSNVSVVLAEDKNGNALPLIPQTKINSTIGAEFKEKGKFHFKNIYVQHIYKFDQNRIGQFETPTKGYHLINLGVDAELKLSKQKLIFSTGVKNALNSSYIDHLSRFKPMSIPNPGINFYVGVKVVF
jgi:iron complex outermembrane receptor protein